MAWLFMQNILKNLQQNKRTKQVNSVRSQSTKSIYQKINCISVYKKELLENEILKMLFTIPYKSQRT